MGFAGNIVGEGGPSNGPLGFSNNRTGSLILDKVDRRLLIILGFSGCLVTLCSALVATYATPAPEVDPNMAGIRAAVAML